MVGTCLLPKGNCPLAIIQIIFTQSKYEQKCYIHQKILFLTQHLHFFKIGILNIQHAISPATTYEPKNQKVLLGATKKNKFKNLCLNCGTLSRK